MNGFKLYWRLVRNSIRSQLQYRGSIILQSIGQMLVTGGEFIGIWALFSRFGSLEGWSMAEVAILYGITNVGFAIAEALTQGFDNAGDLIRYGTFDRIMLRPRSTALMVLGHDFQMRRAGRLLQGAAILGYGLVAVRTGAPIPGLGSAEGHLVAGALPGIAGTALLLTWTILGCAFLFVGIRITQACISFKTVESIEIMNVFTFGGAYAASYPFPIFVNWFRKLFTFGVPLAAVSYYPGLVLMGRTDPIGAPIWVGWVTPAAGIGFCALTLLLWKWSLRWYSSTGT